MSSERQLWGPCDSGRSAKRVHSANSVRKAAPNAAGRIRVAQARRRDRRSCRVPRMQDRLQHLFFKGRRAAVPEELRPQARLTSVGTLRVPRTPPTPIPTACAVREGTIGNVATRAGHGSVARQPLVAKQPSSEIDLRGVQRVSSGHRAIKIQTKRTSLMPSASSSAVDGTPTTTASRPSATVTKKCTGTHHCFRVSRVSRGPRFRRIDGPAYRSLVFRPSSCGQESARNTSGLCHGIRALTLAID